MEKIHDAGPEREEYWLKSQDKKMKQVEKKINEEKWQRDWSY